MDGKNKSYKTFAIVLFSWVTFCYLAIIQNLVIAEVAFYYGLLSFVTYNWVSYVRKEYKKLTLGFCTFLTVIVGMVVIGGNPILTCIMSLVSMMTFVQYFNILRGKND